MRVPGSATLRAEPRSLVGRHPGASEAWIGLGANVGDRQAAILAAVGHFGSCVEGLSPLYETAPWGILSQPWFLNGVLRIRWAESPRALLERCLGVEAALGRVRSQRNGPRIIDLDVLILGRGQCLEEGLSVPHPGIRSRRSVLEPWGEVAPSLIVPGLERTVGDLRFDAASLPGQEVRRLS